MTLQIGLNIFCTAIIMLAVIVVIRSTGKINKAAEEVRQRIDHLAERVSRLEADHNITPPPLRR